MPSMFLGMILLVSIDWRTRSSAITRSSTGKPSVISLAISAVCSFFNVEKLASVILKSEKFTRRSASRDLRVGLDLDGAQVRLGRRRALRRVRHSRVRGHSLLIVPGGNLRLIDEERHAALGDVLPRPAAIGRRRHRRLGRRLCRGGGRLGRGLRRRGLRGLRPDRRSPGARDEIRAGDERDPGARTPKAITHGHGRDSQAAPLRNPNRGPSSPGGTARSAGRWLAR